MKIRLYLDEDVDVALAAALRFCGRSTFFSVSRGERVLEAYPELAREDVVVALEYASQVIDEEKVIRRA